MKKKRINFAFDRTAMKKAFWMEISKETWPNVRDQARKQISDQLAEAYNPNIHSPEVAIMRDLLKQK